MTDLHDALADEFPTPDPEHRDGYRIGGDREATWALRKLAAAHAERDRIMAVAGEEIARITAWRNAAVRGPEADIDFFEAVLIDYRRRLEAENPNLPQTYKLPGGVITRRRSPVRAEVLDPEAFTAWALVHDPAAVKVTPLVSALGSYQRTDEGDVVSPDGEVVPGVHVVGGDDRYAAKPEAAS